MSIDYEKVEREELKMLNKIAGNGEKTYEEITEQLKKYERSKLNLLNKIAENGSSGAISIDDNHIFGTKTGTKVQSEQARDTYYSANTGEFEENKTYVLLVYTTGTDLQIYTNNTPTWTDVSLAIRGEKGEKGDQGDEANVDLSDYQTKDDNSLNTNSKVIVGAINEILPSSGTIGVGGDPSTLEDGLYSVTGKFNDGPTDLEDDGYLGLVNVITNRESSNNGVITFYSKHGMYFKLKINGSWQNKWISGTRPSLVHFYLDGTFDGQFVTKGSVITIVPSKVLPTGSKKPNISDLKLEIQGSYATVVGNKVTVTENNKRISIKAIDLATNIESYEIIFHSLEALATSFELKYHASHGIIEGESITVTLDVKTIVPSNAGVPGLNFEVTNGSELVIMEHSGEQTGANFTLLKPGNFTIRATDIISGTYAEKTFEILQG